MLLPDVHIAINIGAIVLHMDSCISYKSALELTLTNVRLWPNSAVRRSIADR